MHPLPPELRRRFHLIPGSHSISRSPSEHHVVRSGLIARNVTQRYPIIHLPKPARWHLLVKSVKRRLEKTSGTHESKAVMDVIFFVRLKHSCTTSDFEDEDEFCPHCDNHFVLEAIEPEASLGVEGEDIRIDSR
jgi:hypothetical protein